MPFHHIFGRRLAFLLDSLDFPHHLFAEKISSHDHHKAHISPGLVSHWLSGKRDPAPYITQISQVLRPALKHQLNFSLGDLLQELADWHGLLGMPDVDKHLRALFPEFQAPLLVGNFPRLQLPSYHVERPELGVPLLEKLLAPNEENGKFERHGLALIGWPGLGKSVFAFELLQQARPFFMGGTLFGNLRRSSPQQILHQWANDLRIPLSENQHPTNMALAINAALEKRSGRWLCFLDEVSAPEELTDLLLPQAWALVTTQGLHALLPHGLEDWAVQLPPFTKDEAVAVFQKRLGARWEKYHDHQRVKKLYDLVEGLPMAISILAGIVHSRGWDYPLSRFQDEMRIISTINLAPGMQPELNLQMAIEFALDIVSEELHDLLRAMSVFTPGVAIPSFILEMFLKRFGAIEQKPGAWLAKLETLRESGLIERIETEEDPAIHYWRIHRTVALYISGQLAPDELTFLQQQMKQLLSQHALAAQAHPCLPSLVLPALKRRRTAWPHLKWVHDRMIEWFQGQHAKTGVDYYEQEFLQMDALYLSRFIHALFGPEKALEYLNNLCPGFGNPRLLLTWASYKLFCQDTPELIDRLKNFLEKTRLEPLSSTPIRVHACLGQAYLIAGHPEDARGHLSSATFLSQQISNTHDPRIYFAKAELHFAHGKEAAFLGEWTQADIFYTQAVVAYCWPALPLELKTEPGVTLGNPHAEEAGHHYPWLVRLMETVWALVEIRMGVGLYKEAYELIRQATRLALSMPWVYALDHLFLFVRVASLIRQRSSAEEILRFLARGEPYFEQPPCRSQLGAILLLSELHEKREKFVKLAHAFRHHGWKKWAIEAQRLAENPSLPSAILIGNEPLEDHNDFAKARSTLQAWQDHLGLPGFLSDAHPLPSQLPW